jgi:peptidoglycan/xylan/chitin deacetylase (PgdA/CDA1 family)
MIDVAIRFDDPSASSDHALERKLLQIMAECNVRSTFVVVPCIGQHALTGADMPHLVDAVRQGRVEIAQHGYDHEAMDDVGIPSEFAGADPAVQSSKIVAGRDILEAAFDIRLHGFVPPFNTFDRSTAALLARHGFRYLSAAHEGDVIERGQLILLPRTCHLSELRRAIAEARLRPAGNLAIVVVMHHYDFEEGEEQDTSITLQEFSSLLQWMSCQPDIRVMPLSELTARHSLQTWRKAMRRAQWVHRQHWRLRALFPRFSLMPQPLVNYMRMAVSQS